MRDQLVLLLTNGATVDAATGFCQRQGNMDLDSARRVVVEARQRITIAAEYVRDEQLGKALLRLDDLYSKSMAMKDARTALQAQRELNRLLRLYSPRDSGDPDIPTDAQEATQRLELIATYLVPLNLADERYPVEEHARLAAETIRASRSV